MKKYRPSVITIGAKQRQMARLSKLYSNKTNKQKYTKELQELQI